MNINMGLNQYVDKVASKERTPGGGSVAAILGSLGCSLASMVANLTFEKDLYKALGVHQKEAFSQSFEELQQLIKKLNQLAEEDTCVFDEVLKAMSLPKNTKQEKYEQKKAIEKATQLALQTPLNTAKVALEALELQSIFVKWGNPDTMSDMGVGIWSVYAALEGALITVKINLYNLSDEVYKNKVLKECEKIMIRGRKLRDQHLDEVYKKLDN